MTFSQYIKYRSETQDNNAENLDQVVDEQIENNSAQKTKRSLIDGNLYKRYQKRFYQTLELNTKQFIRQKFDIETKDGQTVLQCVCQIRKEIDDVRTITISLINLHIKIPNTTSPTNHHFFNLKLLFSNLKKEFSPLLNNTQN